MATAMKLSWQVNDQQEEKQLQCNIKIHSLRYQLVHIE